MLSGACFVFKTLAYSFAFFLRASASGDVDNYSYFESRDALQPLRLHVAKVLYLIKSEFFHDFGRFTRKSVCKKALFALR